MEKKKSKSEQEWISIFNNNISLEQRNVIQANSKELPIDILGLTKDLGISVYRPYIATDLDGWIEYDNKEEIEEDQFKIYLNTKYPARKQRFTLAHELAHYLLHKDEIIKEGQLDRAYQLTGYFDKKEAQANLYASELLIPTDLIFEMIENEPRYLKDKNIFVEDLVKRCNVSKATALRRASRAIKHFNLMNS